MRDGRGSLAAAAVAAVAMAVAAAFLLGGQGPADASTLSRGSGGWLAARRYLESRGAQVDLLDRSLDTVATRRGVLVLAFPWQRFALEDVGTAVERHLHRGGDVLFAYTDDRDPMQSELVESVGLSWKIRRPRPPLAPLRWRRYANEEWTLTAPDGPARPARVRALRSAPGAPPNARVLLQDDEGRPFAFVYGRSRGRVAVVPSELFANARLAQAGNADVLEALRQELGETWLVDEFHHGLRAPDSPTATSGPRVLAMYVMQVAFVYALCALAVARRFGPAWREPIVSRGSAATFLVGLGALHDRLGHHAEAARLLVSRARELAPHLALRHETASDAPGLLKLARHIGIRQSGGRTE